MKEAAEVARKERDRRAGGGSVHDRIAGRAEYREREQALRKEEVSAAFDPPGLIYWWALTGTCVNFSVLVRIGRERISAMK